jgi:K+/H+ antiporter YhaU regulatory subunit KhtT
VICPCEIGGVVLAIVRTGGNILFDPSPDEIMHAQDALVVVRSGA